ncbi:Myb-like DNA-binding domain containing protein [Trichomonas vaginalis G3]|uniref:Myb-like DNA-binding domain containing protein n=1 Tax=Trichomonas vaginalis (strain ATCC PRA-98 / G3) TaxID=412133 RepID=A2DS27_TRIV3|nr:RNA polymerase II transcription regulator recruiting protein [Trichomonas vaginalis G3]EAY16797.1 Myb-like DNA-binding domain containing protein [Trichomonas vaginalis G3]KAI5490594.1 RNA polymerase II transcription regulator recruiting protein [Trichomonas vaginalis G3]|eukprot:XP_001329020.1 Myb-like DNA-binding domain containing protein [Trichomonas vaginalis G3]
MQAPANFKIDAQYSTSLRKRFTEAEDNLLRTLRANDKMTWDEIASYLPGRTGRQCKDRYNNYLNQQIVLKNWTTEEDFIIIQKYQQYGPRWTTIAKFLNNRSGNNVKNRWYKSIALRYPNLQTVATAPRHNKKPESPVVENQNSDSSSEVFNDDIFEYHELDDPFLLI